MLWRIRNAQKELEFVAQNASFFDYVLINDDFSLTSNSFFRLSRDEYKWLPSPAKMQLAEENREGEVPQGRTRHVGPGDTSTMWGKEKN